MSANLLEDAIQEIVHAKKECLGLLQQLKEFYPVDSGKPYPETYRLLVTPMLYSAWERCFTLCHSVALRLIRDMAVNVQSLESTERAIWLLHTPFYNSFVSQLQNQVAKEGKKNNKGHFQALCEFLLKFEEWAPQKLEQSIETGSLVMTFSNVNPDVVEMNAKAIGISDFHPFKSLMFGRLHDLVGRRNEIGHGAIIEPPANEAFKNLWEFTETLVEKYCDVFVDWIRIRFGENPPGEDCNDIPSPTV